MNELLRRGKTVRMVNHSGKADLPAGVELIAADAYDPASARRAASGATVIYQCAQPEYHDWPEKFPALQAGILEAAAAAGAKFIVGDNLYMYGPVGGPIREDLPYQATGPKGITRARMAQAVLEAHRSGKVRAALGRGSDFFGPYVRDSAVGEIVFGAAVQGKAAQALGKIDLPHTYTYIEDFGRALVTLGERDEALGQAWHVPSAAPVSSRRFIEMVYAAAGKTPKMQAAGPFMFDVLSMFVPVLREMRELKYQMVNPFQVDSSKFERTFGVRPTPLEESIPATVRWFQEHKPAAG
jgi:nucleoside-diphosphate-sugar epimerase